MREAFGAGDHGHSRRFNLDNSLHIYRGSMIGSPATIADNPQQIIGAQGKTRTEGDDRILGFVRRKNYVPKSQCWCMKSFRPTTYENIRNGIAPCCGRKKCKAPR